MNVRSHGVSIRWRLSIAAMTCGALLAGCDGELRLFSTEGATADYGTVPNEPSDDPGTPEVEEAPIPRASLHRLNAIEYDNSVRDLLGTTLSPARSFPPDASIDGFDNQAEALSITPTLMGQYVGAAHDVVEDAFADRPAFRDIFEEDDPRLTYGVDRDANRIGGIVRLRNGAVTGEIVVPETGAHTVSVRAQGITNGGAAAPRMRITIAGEERDVAAPLDGGDTTFAMELPAGTHAIGVAPLNFEENAAANVGNDILFDRFVVRSDEIVAGPARSRILTCDPSAADGAACASRIVASFARLAWRRPLTADETAKLDALLVAVRSDGEAPEEAIKLALRAILTSPKFLYRYRTLEDGDGPTSLDPYVLASRLSFFIWSSTPDARLLDAAAAGTLQTPEGIRQTVAWMVADDRAVAMADGFAEQWLDLRHLEQASPSSEVYPEFDERLRESMRLESKLFFLDYLTNDAPVSTMLAPDFAYRDAALAAHVGEPGPEGEGFERMSATAGDRRGVLALTAWLTSRSDSEHSSPIRRGAWIADAMLCAPVPPPPPNLEIGELESGDGALSVREQLERHRTERACATCHARLDVIGMGFEMYDGVGKLVDDPALDSVGDLPDGSRFRGADEMAAALDPETFVGCVSQKLMTYALGRSADRYDLAELEIPPNATLVDLVTAVALSPSFRQPVPLK